MAKNLLKLLERNPTRLDRIRFLAGLFKENGYEIKIAGGAVRDLLKQTEPPDIDFATNAHPDETLRILKKHEHKLRIIVTAAGQKHGTVSVKFFKSEKRLKLSNPKQDDRSTADTERPEYDEESPYEITTLRCDKFTNGRHAEVEFINDWKKDAERRDLTINSMFLNMDDGRVVDYFGGEDHLKRKIIRFVGDPDARIKEDYLRILRFFRFWLRFSEGGPDSDQLEAIKDNLSGLNQISGERINTEIKKTFCILPCSRVVKLMLDIHLFEFFGLENHGCSSYEAYAERVMDRVKLIETNLQKYDLATCSKRDDLKVINDLKPIIIFSACFEKCDQLFKAHERLKFSKMERDTILYIIENRSKHVSLGALKYQLVLDNGPGRKTLKQHMIAYLISIGQFDLIEQLNDFVIPSFPLNGKQIADAVKEKKLPQNKIKDIINEIKLEWAKSDYQADDIKLMEIMRTKIDEMAAPKKQEQSNN